MRTLPPLVPLAVVAAYLFLKLYQAFSTYRLIAMKPPFTSSCLRHRPACSVLLHKIALCRLREIKALALSHLCPSLHRCLHTQAFSLCTVLAISFACVELVPTYWAVLQESLRVGDCRASLQLVRPDFGTAIRHSGCRCRWVRHGSNSNEHRFCGAVRD